MIPYSFDHVMLMARHLLESLQEAVKAEDITDSAIQAVFEEMFISTDIVVSNEVSFSACAYLHNNLMRSSVGITSVFTSSIQTTSGL